MSRLLLAGSLMMVVVQSAGAAITDNLVVYLPFDETSGTIAQDRSGNGYDADIFNRRTLGDAAVAVEDGPLPTPDNGGTEDWWFWDPDGGRFRGAFVPRGLPDQLGQTTAPSIPFSPNGQVHAMAASSFGDDIDSPEWSVSVWAKMPYADAATTQVDYFNAYDWRSDSGDATPDFWASGGSSEIDSPRWLFGQRESSGGLHFSYAGGGAHTDANATMAEGGGALADLADGEWHNIVMVSNYNIETMDPSVQDGFVYVDGQLAQTISFSGATRNNGIIGAVTVAQASTFGGDTTALIDDFAVWNRALTTEEIAFLSQNAVISALLGDMDCDGDVDFDDIDPFVLGLTDPGGYETIFGVPPTLKGDTDGDGDFDFDDIGGFVDILTPGQGPHAVPEPSTCLLSLVACAILATISGGRGFRGGRNAG